MSKHGCAEWNSLAKVAHQLGTLTAADLRAFELLCELLATERQARETIARDGMTVATAGGTVKPHPTVRTLENARRQATALLAAFGLTPKGRGAGKRAAAPAMKTDDEEKGTDPWRGVL